MIRIEQNVLAFLLRGRVIAVELSKQPARPYSRSRTYAVALPGKKSATCRVQVLEADGLTLRIRHAPGAEDKPRMLARGFGYTSLSDPLEAGECPRPAELERYSDEGRQRHDQEKVRRANEAGAMPLYERLLRLERAYARGEAILGPDLRVIRQRLYAIERNA